jgi:hypothetical protein
MNIETAADYLFSQRVSLFHLCNLVFVCVISHPVFTGWQIKNPAFNFKPGVIIPSGQ